MHLPNQMKSRKQVLNFTKFHIISYIRIFFVEIR
nr:MAG TPA: hypothetical protein [Bacteriophage sp.]